jgi:DNA-binding cell septation regulator SpoVG
MNDMDVKAEMHLMNLDTAKETDLVAVGDVTIGGCYSIHNVKALNLDRNGKKELVAVIPNRKNPKTGEWENLILLSTELSAKVKHAAVEETKRQMDLAIRYPADDDMEIAITLCKEDYWPTVAYATVSFGNEISIKKIRLVEGDTGLKVCYPTTKSGRQYIQLFSGATPMHTNLIDYSIILEFQKKYEMEYGVAYQTAEKKDKPEVSHENHGQKEKKQSRQMYGGR